jgi:uncharacterized glyoxalase superfamily protein PhnB
MLANRSIPRSSVIPELGYPDVGEAVAWLTDVFGFTPWLLIANHRAQMLVGDGAIVVTEGPGGQSAVLIRVEDVDRHHDRAKERGARIVRPPTDYPFGERQYTAEDFAGHRWTFSQSIADVDPADWGGTLVNDQG